MDDGTIQMAERHVAEARRIVTAQRALIKRLRLAGCDTPDAEQTLFVFESSLRVFEHHRDWLRQRHALARSSATQIMPDGS